MKPNFALSLSFQGIRLLHRAAGGWRVVGDVALDAADMAGELAVLRRTATALEPGGLRTKLLLPQEQIKYLTIDTPDMDAAAIDQAARAALDGATPYSIADLAFDVSPDGAQTHIAAVVRDTLAEAEAFALEHRFHPLSFATIPADNPYLGEPFFGATKAAAELLGEGESVEPDGIAVVVIGDVDVTSDDGPVVTEAEGEAESKVAEVETVADAAIAADTEEVVEDAADASDEPVAEDKSDAVEDAPEAARTLPADESVTEELPLEVSEKSADDIKGEDEPADTSVEEEPKAGADEGLDAEPVTDAASKPQEMRAENDDLETSVKATEDTIPASEDTSDAETPSEADTPPADPIPVLPSLGAASRAAPAAGKIPAAPAVDTPAGFASRRGAATPEKPPARREPVVTAPTLPAEPATVETVSPNTLPPAPPAIAAPDSSSLTPVAEPRRVAAPPTGSFLSRRRGEAAERAAAATVPSRAPTASSEAERMTIFGARRDIGGKPRFLGLILTAALLVFLAGVAAWASVFLDEGLSLSRLFGDRAPKEVVETPAPDTTTAPENVQTASLSPTQGPTLSEEDTAVLDALRDPVVPQVQERTPDELEASYATSGIWPIAPVVPPDPAGLISIDDLYVTSIDPVSTATDAVALPALASFATDVPFGSVVTPAAAGTVFALDAAGLVIPTAQGALSPDGFTVYLGRPDLIPPQTPTRFQAVPDIDPAQNPLAALRPKNRPSDLAESNERANLDGLTRNELAGFRPRFRPKSIQQQAAAAAAAKAEAASVDTSEAVEAALAVPAAPPSPFVDATRLAIKASVRPDTRPRNFARIVKRAQRTPQPQAETRVATTGTVAPRVVTPKVPSKTSVAKQATVRNAINLRKVNLIGVYGKPSNRRALVRLSNGRYKKVVVGDRIDGGRVSAIGDSELRYKKRGRDVVLKMPRS